MQMAYVAQQRLDGYAEAVAHAIKCKTVFDKQVLSQKPGECNSGLQQRAGPQTPPYIELDG